jgi:hypothetical protein
MRNWMVGMVVVFAVALLFPSTPPPRAQAPKQPAAAKPAPPPAAPRDLSGVWNAKNPRGTNLLDSWGKVPPVLTPWGEEQFKTSKASNGGTFTLDQTNDPVITKCLPPGVPRIYIHPFPMQITQTPKEIIFLYEYDHTVRQVFIDGRKHPDDVTPTYMGNSIGTWEGSDTLVVDTIGFNDSTWLDRIGHRHSDQLHVVERFKRLDRDNLQIDITMEDPKALAKPWQGQMFYGLRPDWDITEQVCTDNSDFLNFEK